jgi:hypothetical protein
MLHKLQLRSLARVRQGVLVVVRLVPHRQYAETVTVPNQQACRGPVRACNKFLVAAMHQPLLVHGTSIPWSPRAVLPSLAVQLLLL